MSDITVVILTYNEARNIGDCLRHLAWADDVILVDSGSLDNTIQIARECRPDVRVLENPFEDFGQQRNWALDNISPHRGWILFLDADEHATESFANAVQEAIRKDSPVVGYFLTYRNMFLGTWLKRSTFYPSWQLRLLRHGHMRYRKEGHGQSELTNGPLGYIERPYDHFPFQNGLKRWIAKHNEYSSSECELVLRLRAEPLRLADLFSQNKVVRRRALKQIASRMWFRPTLRFLYTYLFRMGCLDGRAGYIYCRLMAQYEFQLLAKLAETKHELRSGT
ncbi:MAG: glycosyltransferase family 2 protein [Planctomycetaceae bacterium]|nr:glycosyltransferase family 2 protein [Planctomycetaceae bacterium]